MPVRAGFPLAAGGLGEPRLRACVLADVGGLGHLRGVWLCVFSAGEWPEDVGILRVGLAELWAGAWSCVPGGFIDQAAGIGFGSVYKEAPHHLPSHEHWPQRAGGRTDRTCHPHKHHLQMTPSYTPTPGLLRKQTNDEASNLGKADTTTTGRRLPSSKKHCNRVHPDWGADRRHHPFHALDQGPPGKQSEAPHILLPQQNFSAPS